MIELGISISTNQYNIQHNEITEAFEHCPSVPGFNQGRIESGDTNQTYWGYIRAISEN